PITNEEYFRLFAILNNTEDADRSDESPVFKLFTEEQKHQQHQWETEIARLEKVVQTSTPALVAAQVEWEKLFTTDPKWQIAKPAAMKSKAGAAMAQNEDGSIRVERTGKTDVYTFEIPVTADNTIAAL